MSVKLIGLVLLLYGILGVIGTVVIYLFLVKPQGPIQQLKKLLVQIAQKVSDTVGLVNRSIGMARDLKTILRSTHDQLGQVPQPLQQVADGLGTIETVIQNVENGLNSVHIHVPVLPPTTTPQTFSVSIPTVEGVGLTKLGNLGGFEIWGPPIKITTGSITKSVGPINLPSVNFTQVSPLAPVAQALNPVQAEVTGIKNRVLNIKKTIEQIIAFTEEAETSTDEIIQDVLTPMPGQLDDIRQSLLAISNSGLLRLIPLLVLGYFGLIHLAFSLTGFALLLV